MGNAEYMGEANFYYFTCLKQSADKSLETNKLDRLYC